MARPSMHRVTAPAAWSVLVAPARIEIVEAMRAAAPCAIADIAAILDRPADTLYRHIEKLRRAGLVVLAGTRKRGRRTERVYDLLADDFVFGFRDPSGKSANRAYVECANSFLRSMARVVRDSAAAGQLVAGDDERNLILNYELGWLTPAAFREARVLSLRLKELMDQGKRTKTGRLYLALTALAPVTRRRGATRSSTSDSRSQPRGKSPKSPALSKPARATKATKSTKATRSTRATKSSKTTKSEELRK